MPYQCEGDLIHNKAKKAFQKTPKKKKCRSWKLCPMIRRDMLSKALREVRQTFVSCYQSLETHNGFNVLWALWTVTCLRVELISALRAAGDLDGDKSTLERQRWGNNSTIQWLSDVGATAKPSPQIALFICLNTKRGSTAQASHAHLPPSATAQLVSL